MDLYGLGKTAFIDLYGSAVRRKGVLGGRIPRMVKVRRKARYGCKTTK